MLDNLEGDTVDVQVINGVVSIMQSEDRKSRSKTVYADCQGTLTVDGKLVGVFSRYPDTLMQVMMDTEGAVIKVLPLDARGNPVIGRDGDPLEIDPARDIEEQCVDKSPDPALSRERALRQLFTEGSEHFDSAAYDAAALLFRVSCNSVPIMN
jgi:hypothetical protein